MCVPAGHLPGPRTRASQLPRTHAPRSCCPAWLLLRPILTRSSLKIHEYLLARPPRGWLRSTSRERNVREFKWKQRLRARERGPRRARASCCPTQPNVSTPTTPLALSPLSPPPPLHPFRLSVYPPLIGLSLSFSSPFLQSEELFPSPSAERAAHAPGSSAGGMNGRRKRKVADCLPRIAQSRVTQGRKAVSAS